MLYALGPVIFQVVPLNTDAVAREGEASFAEHAVVGAAPVYERTGEGARVISIKGAVFPEHFGGLADLAALDALRAAGMPQYLLRGDGTPMGWVLIEKMKEEHEHLAPNGVGRAISYALELKRCDAPFAASLIDFIGGLLR